MAHSIAQIYCSHCDLGRFKGVCGELGSGSMRNRLLGLLSQRAHCVALAQLAYLGMLAAMALGLKPAMD